MAQNLFSAMTPEGAALGNLVTALYAGDPAGKRAERDAAIANKNADTDMKRAKVLDYERKKAETEAQSRAQAENISSLVGWASGGQPQGAANLDYFKAGGQVQPQAETAEQPGIVGGYPMDKPPSYDNLQRVMTGIYGEKSLGGKNFEQAAKGSASYQNQSIIGDVLNGLRSPEASAGAVAAGKGTLPFKEDRFGGTLDQYSGAVNQSTPLAAANIGDINAQAGQRTAAGAASTAHAGLFRDQAGKVRTETLPQVQVPGPGGVGTVPAAGRDVGRAGATAAFKPAPEAGIDDAAVEDAAHRYYIDGTLPPNLGRGVQGQATTAKILNRASAIARENGDAGEQGRINQIANRASGSALMQLTKQEGQVGAFERNAIRNADIALQNSRAVDRTGMPVLNRWLLSGMKNVAGDPDVAKFNQANDTFVSEYAKIMSGSMGNSPVSDSLRKEVHTLLSTKDTPEQYEAVVNQMKLEMRNRMIGFDEQKKQIRGSMGGSQRAPGTNATPATASAPAAPAASPSGPKRFNSEAEASAAEASGALRKGERVIINGSTGTWQ